MTTSNPLNLTWRDWYSARIFAHAMAIHNVGLRLVGRGKWLFWPVVLGTIAVSLPFYAASYLLSPRVAWALIKAKEEVGRRADEILSRRASR